MLLVRDIMYCKPGKVRPMVEKFLALAKVIEGAGQGKAQVMTDLSAERYWTVVAQFEVQSMEAYIELEQSVEMQQADEIMKGYHDLVDQGRREIYKIEE